MAREVITTIKLRCDICNSVGTELDPIVTKEYTWENRSWEIDLCPVDQKQVGEMFEALNEKARRPERNSKPKRSASGRRAPYSGDTRFNQWWNEELGMFVCPFIEDAGLDNEHNCPRKFETANGLAIHHERKHGIRL